MLYAKFVLKDSETRFFIQRVSVANEFIFLTIYLYKNIVSIKKRKLLIASIPIFLIFCIFDYIYYKNKGSNSKFGPLTVESLFFLIVIVYYFYEKMKFIISSPIYKSSSFWISVAFLVYFSGTFLLFLTSISMINDKVFLKQYNIIYGSIDILKNFILVIALLINKFSKIDSSTYSIKPNVDLDLFQPFNENPNLFSQK